MAGEPRRDVGPHQGVVLRVLLGFEGVEVVVEDGVVDGVGVMIVGHEVGLKRGD